VIARGEIKPRGEDGRREIKSPFTARVLCEWNVIVICCASARFENVRDCGHATLPAIVRATLPDTTAINIDENVSRDASDVLCFGIASDASY